MMSVGKKTTQYTVAAAIVAIAIIGASFVYIGIPNAFTSSTTTKSTSGSSIGAPSSTLVIQLTDPPQVPPLTTSLEMNYSSISILAAEPSGTPDIVSTATVKITPNGGSATVDLLKLQNLSQTMATASLPNGSVIYSVTFNVTSITIDVNGTTSPVTFASGSSSLRVTISNPSSITGTNVALLQLNPVVVDTANGYQMIPSAVGVLQHDHGQGESQVGSQHKLTSEDQGNLTRAAGNATINLVSLSVLGNQTTMTVQVNNTGNVSIVVNGIGVHGNFTVSPSPCQTTSSSSGQGNQGNQGTSGSSGDSNHSQGDGFVPARPGDSASHGTPECKAMDHPSQVVFVPSIGTTTSNGCAQGNLTLVSGDVPDVHGGNSTLSPGECVDLTFSGVMSFGHSQLVLVPSTASGQSYGVSLIASHGANQQMSCVLNSGTTSCTPASQQHSGDN